jgi:DNA-binding MarR family transcriptional regulator
MFGLMFVLGNKLQAIGDSFYEEITSKQWFVLIMLNVLEGNPTLNELSEGMGSSHQNVKQLVLKLQDKGYLQLFSDENDRRKTRIRMTEACQTLAEKYNERERQFMKLLYQGIDKEKIRITIETLLHFESNMEGLKDENNRSL